MCGGEGVVPKDPLLLASGVEAEQATAAAPAVWNQWISLRMRVLIFISHMCHCLKQLSHLVYILVLVVLAFLYCRREN